MIGDAAPKRVRIAVDLLAILTFLAIISAGFALYFRFSETNRNRQDIKRTWHAVICTIEQSVISDKTMPYKKKVRIVKFYDGLLVNSVGAMPCRLTITKG